MYYAYLLENLGDKSWYIGSTSDLKRRIKEHQTGSGGRTTRIKKNWHLIYYEAYLDKRDAVGREKFLKSGSGRKYLKKQLKNYLSLWALPRRAKSLFKRFFDLLKDEKVVIYRRVMTPNEAKEKIGGCGSRHYY